MVSAMAMQRWWIEVMLQYRVAVVAVLVTVLLTIACGSSEPPPPKAEALNEQEREWLAQYAKNKSTETPQERELLSAQRGEQPPESPQVQAASPRPREAIRALLTKMPGQTKLSPANAISLDAVQKQINALVSSFQRCYEAELVNDPDLAGKLVLGWTVTSKGKVTNSHIVEATMPSDSVKACFVRTATEMKFPKGKTVKVEYAFMMSVLRD